MATLYNTKISATYPGLIKTIDNIAITAALKQLTDGSGNASGLYLNNAGDFKVTSILEWGSLKDTGTGVTITQFVTAADGIGSFNNDTTVPTSAAVKTYVDAVVTASDLDFLGDSNVGTPAVDLDSQNFSIIGTANEIETSGNAQTLTIGLPTSVTISDTFTGATFVGDLNGTINTLTTATTQVAGNNSTKVATTAYVDTLDSASDLDFSGDSGTGDVNLNTQVFAITGTTNQITTAAASQGLSLSLPATVHRNLTGNVTGNVTGDLTGNVTGNVAGDLTGNVTATSVLANGVTATTQTASDNSTKVATTAYVDVLDSASDLDITDGVVTGDVNLNTQSLSILGTTNQVTSTVLNQSVTLSLPSSINVNSASATILETARDISLTGQATATISSFDGSVNVSGAVTLDNNSVTGKVLTGLPTPAAASVLPADSILDGIGKLQSQINGLAGGLRFMGSWNATTNVPSLSSGGGEATSGTTTGTTANKFVDSAANFSVTVTIGDKVVNQVDGQTALVTNVDSSTILSLDADIMVSGEAYTIDNTPFLTQGHYYVVSVGGTTSLNGIANWSVGDWVIAGANNEWTQLDHTDVEGVGTVGNIPKWSATGTIADSIIAESGTEITVSGILSTTTNLNSGSNFAVATNKFTANATTGNVAFPGDLAINTNKFTVNATSGATAAAGTITAPTFSGDLNGTINTVTTATTQAASNNSTKVATTAYADAAATAVPIGDYLPLAGGTLTGGLTGTTATFAGIITVNGGGIDIDNNDDVRLRFDNASVFKAGLQVATTAGDMIAGSAINDFCIRATENMLFSAGGNVESMRIDTSGNATFAGNVTLDNILLTPATLPAINTPSISLRSTNNEIYFQSGSANIFNFMKADYTTMLNLDGTNSATFSANVDIYKTTDSQLQIESLNEDATLIINSGADGVGGANREEGFIKFYQDNAEHFTLGKRNNGQFVLLDNVAAQDVITVQDNGGILLTPSNNLTQITGKLGIGGVATYKLDVRETGTGVTNIATYISATGAGTNNYALYTDASGGSSTNFGFYGNSGKNAFLGDTGIGTDAPSNKLDVYDSSTSSVVVAKFGAALYGTANNTYIEIGTQYADGGSRIGNNNTTGNASSLLFETMTTTSGVYAERMRIDSSGNVTVGGADVNAGRSVMITNSSTGVAADSRLQLVSDTVTFDIIASSAAYTNVASWADAGILSTDANASGGLIFNAQAGGIKFQTGTTERMSITAAGSVVLKSGVNLFLESLSGTGYTWNFNSYSNGNFYLQQGGITNLGVFDGTSGAYTAMSDVNKKKDFEDSEIGLKEVMELQPKLYRMKEDAENSDKLLGFIAQEVKESIPQAYVENGADDNKFIGLNQMPIIAALTKAIQELNAKVEMLEKNCNCKN